MNLHHGDTEARSSAGLLSESLTESIIGAAIMKRSYLPTLGSRASAWAF
jgi:hypothetical protein